MRDDEYDDEELPLSESHVAELIRSIDELGERGREALLTGLECAAWPTQRAMSQ